LPRLDTQTTHLNTIDEGGTPMHTMRGIHVAVLTAALLIPTQAFGQSGRWDAPSFMRPGSPNGLSLALTDSDPGGGLGVMGLWRSSPAPSGIGFRAGLSEAPGDDLVGLFGIDVSGSMTGPMGPGAPEAIWWTGVGVGLGDEVTASIPLGLAFGWTGRDEGVSFMPYVGGHVVLDVMSGPGDAMDLDGVVDLGVDLTFDRGWTIRFGAALGGREALGIGFRVPG
jgi:hypothetical protein